MAPGSNDKHEDGSSLPNGYNEEHAVDGNTDDRSKTARHPRWTRQETIVLIQGKRVVEDQIRGFRTSTSAFRSDQSEPKWDSVASYCKQYGVNRRPVQCRKRWGNLLVDFRKIKRWESQMKEEKQSFWVMRNESRKQMKLPGYFDRKVYDVLDGVLAIPAVPLTTMSVLEEDEDDEVFDSDRSTAAGDGLFSDSEPSQRQEIGHNPEKETTERQSPSKKVAAQLHVTDTLKEKLAGTTTANGSTTQERWKRRRLSSCISKETNMGDLLFKVLERNNSMLNTQLEAQNINCQLDREQKKEHSDNLMAAMNKLTDALLRIANKL